MVVKPMETGPASTDSMTVEGSSERKLEIEHDVIDDDHAAVG